VEEGGRRQGVVESMGEGVKAEKRRQWGLRGKKGGGARPQGAKASCRTGKVSIDLAETEVVGERNRL